MEVVQVYYRRQWSLSGCQGWLQGLDQWPESLTCPQAFRSSHSSQSSQVFVVPHRHESRSVLQPTKCNSPHPSIMNQGSPCEVSADHLRNILKFFFRFVSEYHQVHYLKSPCHRFINKLSPFTKSLTGFNGFSAVYKRTDSRSALTY